jgi:DNA topoisomerase-2
MNTPILKARKGAQERIFYNEGEFESWKSSSLGVGVDISSWNVKYYKGLGTSTAREFREYFEHKKVVDFEYTGEPSDNSIDLVFNKKRADDRKEWLSTYNRSDHLDTSNPRVTYEDFMTREMKHFSVYDTQRSIANGMDGLKISLRKILFSPLVFNFVCFGLSGSYSTYNITLRIYCSCGPPSLSLRFSFGLHKGPIRFVILGIVVS